MASASKDETSIYKSVDDRPACPLLGVAYVAGGRSLDTWDQIECRGDACEWWVADREACAVTVLGLHADWIACALANRDILRADDDLS